MASIYYSDTNTNHVTFNQKGKVTQTVKCAFPNPAEVQSAKRFVALKYITYGRIPHPESNIYALVFDEMELNTRSILGMCSAILRYPFMRLLSISGDNISIPSRDDFFILNSTVCQHPNISTIELKNIPYIHHIVSFLPKRQDGCITSVTMFNIMIKRSLENIQEIEDYINFTKNLKILRLNVLFQAVIDDEEDPFETYDWDNFLRVLDENTTLISLELPASFKISLTSIERVTTRNALAAGLVKQTPLITDKTSSEISLPQPVIPTVSSISQKPNLVGKRPPSRALFQEPALKFQHTPGLNSKPFASAFTSVMLPNEVD